MLEIRNIRSAEVVECGHPARRAHAAVRGENVDIYSRRSVQNVNIYSGATELMSTSIPVGEPKMSTSIRAEAPAADVAREQPGNPDGVGFGHGFQRAEGRILRFDGV